MGKPLKITALSPQELANLLAQASRKSISPDDVRMIAEAAGIIAPDGTINLVDYTAYLALEVTHGSD